MSKKNTEKKKRTRGLWTGLFLLAVSAGFVVWCGLWGLARFLPPTRVPSSSLRADLPQSAVPYSRQGPETLSLSVPVYLQNPELPAGCEVTSAAMLLAAYGYATDKLTVAAALPKCPLELHDGLLYGPHPSEAFIGSPDSSYGFGVFAPAVAKTMQAIIDLQRPFFLEGDESLLKPMILKDVAERTGLDISTISRVSNSKYVQTNYGIYPLKYFFSDGYTTEDGEEMSVREIRKILKECIEGEDKKKPLTDDELADILKEKGYPIARRTVAKYRQQLNIPVARLRK